MLGQKRINRSLGTASKRDAILAHRAKSYELDRFFADLRSKACRPSSSGVTQNIAISSQGLTLREAYERFLADASKSRSDKTLLSYATVSTTIMDILGGDTPLQSIGRAHCRELLAALAKLPLHARKRWPDRSAVEAITLGSDLNLPLLSPAHINGYMVKFCSLLNWATKEELIQRNPALGLRIHDPVAPRDKRKPFTTGQLQRIFGAPLFRGCVDDQDGYATPGPSRPRRARYWIPIIGLYTGMRMNEACQLDTADVRLVDEHMCFVVTTESAHGGNDKRLKTLSSRRIIPVHPTLLYLGFAEYWNDRRSAGDLKLFPELVIRHGLYSHLVSRWFTRFLTSCGAAAERTCYHSLRHNFRDACRSARIDRDITLALGGWSAGSDSSGSVADSYGRGHQPDVLSEAISRIAFPDIDWAALR